ncbi:protein phosphatase 2C domain-containing protein [Frankia sp. AgB32]|uniref:protein phosphatase 2C domain-containing protein n=1 Tax=Frankia sp. AgB32 TaxID=631119 RepID=UPI00200CF1E2|nr:protein phosphatase 2C domain-containing protein [Frankia sp. AgB32]MCK9896124.1 protein phosphatase 2C domain-containing protein [Frankia sp. AgB32]
MLRSISRPGKADNEDAAGAREGALWVIDGATPLGGEAQVDGRSPAAWLSSTADAFLAGAPWAGEPLRAVVRRLIDHLRIEGRRAGLGPGAFPTATLSLARLSGRELELCLLGDSPVVLRRPGAAPVVFGDPQFDGVEEALLREIGAELDRGTDPVEAYGRARARSRERRARRNTAAGLWVLADVPAAAEHAFVASVPVPAGTELVVMSDGFARALCPFGLVADEDALLDEIAAGRDADLLDRLRAAEHADPACVRHPRFTRSDDATMLYARL